MSEGPEVGSGEEALELSLEIHPDRATVSDPVTARVTLTNVGESPLTVNGRMLLSLRRAPSPRKEVFLELEGPPGFRSRKRVQVDAGRPTPEDFVRLPPGGSTSETYPLLRYFTLDRSGEYRLRATYSNQVARSGDGRPAWTGRLRSEWVSLELLP